MLKKLTITSILCLIAWNVFGNDFPPYWEKYFDEKFQTVNNNIDTLKGDLKSFKDETEVKITEQNKCIVEQDKRIISLEKDADILRYVVWSLLGLGGLGTGGALFRQKTRRLKKEVSK